MKVFKKLTTKRSLLRLYSKKFEPVSEKEWKERLTPEEYYVLRQKGTEKPYKGALTDHWNGGVYNCRGCGSPLYKSSTKFDSGCGWPAFWDAIPGAVERVGDNSHGMRRVEIVCSNCKGHLGHVFKGEGFKTPTNERHCVNSISLTFEEQ